MNNVKDLLRKEAMMAVSDLLRRHEENSKHIKEAFEGLGYECE